MNKTGVNTEIGPKNSKLSSPICQPELVPVVLRESNVLDYHSEVLHKRVDKKLNLVIGCELEVEIRCATIQAVERIRDKLNEKYAKSVNDACIAVTVDWWLWEFGEARRDDEKWRPHHRTRTTYY